MQDGMMCGIADVNHGNGVTRFTENYYAKIKTLNEFGGNGQTEL